MISRVLYTVRVVGSMVSAVNEISADVVSAGGPSDTRSSGLQLLAEDAPPRSGLSQTADHSNLLLHEPACERSLLFHNR